MHLGEMDFLSVSPVPRAISGAKRPAKKPCPIRDVMH